MANSAIPTKFTSLVPTNGNQFTGSKGTKVIFELEPSLGYVKGRDSYLTLKVLNNDTSDRGRTMFNNMAGVSSIISRVDIYSLKTGQHLETMENYNMWAAVENQYFYDDKTNIQSLQGVGIDCFANDINQAGDEVPSVPQTRHVNDCVLSPVDKTGNPVYNYRVFTTPLKAGIFRWWDDEKLCPVLNLLGLRIEITLEDPKVALLNLSVVSDDGHVYAVGKNQVGMDALVPTGAATDSFVELNPSGGLTDAVVNCGFAVGNSITITGTGFADEVRTITSITITGITTGAVRLEFTGALPNVYTADTKVKLTNDNRAYKVEPEFRVLQVMPQDMSGAMGGIDYEFTTYDMYFDTLFASQRKHQVDIPTVQSRALAIMSMFHNPAGEQDNRYSSLFTGASPKVLKLDSVQYFIKGRLQPVRAYNPKPLQEKIISEHELVKALTTINKEPQDLGQSDQYNLNDYTNTYVVARELARGNYFYDLTDAEPQIRLGFDDTRTQNYQVSTFVWSKRVVVADPQQGIRVIL